MDKQKFIENLLTSWQVHSIPNGGNNTVSLSHKSGNQYIENI